MELTKYQVCYIVYLEWKISKGAELLLGYNHLKGFERLLAIRTIIQYQFLQFFTVFAMNGRQKPFYSFSRTVFKCVCPERDSNPYFCLYEAFQPGEVKFLVYPWMATPGQSRHPWVELFYCRANIRRSSASLSSMTSPLKSKVTLWIVPVNSNGVL
jgi:hypothetical protein